MLWLAGGWYGLVCVVRGRDESIIQSFPSGTFRRGSVTGVAEIES